MNSTCVLYVSIRIVYIHVINIYAYVSISDGAKNCGLFCTFTNAVSSMKIDETADIFQLVRLLQLRRPEFFADFVSINICLTCSYYFFYYTNNSSFMMGLSFLVTS